MAEQQSVWDRLERHGNYDVHDIADAIARGRLLEARDKAVTEAIEKAREYAEVAHVGHGPLQHHEQAVTLALCNAIDKAREAAYG